MIAGRRTLQPLLERVPRDTRRKLWGMTVRGGRWAAGPTARLRVLPDYLIVGAQRCGTTSLQQYLVQHPWITSARLAKGVHYFDTNYHRGLDWYRSHFHTAASQRVREQLRGGTLRVGDASPYYLFHPAGPERIASTLPGVQVVVLLRDPVARAYSHYLHEVRRGFEDLSFADALAAEPQRLAGEAERLRRDPGYRSRAHQHHSYAARGRYAEQLERLTAVIPPERVLVLESEAFFADPESAYLRTLDFLGVPRWSPPAFTRENANRYPRDVPRGVLDELRAGFAESNARLNAFLGRRLSWS